MIVAFACHSCRQEVQSMIALPGVDGVAVPEAVVQNSERFVFVGRLVPQASRQSTDNAIQLEQAHLSSKASPHMKTKCMVHLQA